jgi:hypothetical protein
MLNLHANARNRTDTHAKVPGKSRENLSGSKKSIKPARSRLNSQPSTTNQIITITARLGSGGMPMNYSEKEIVDHVWNAERIWQFGPRRPPGKKRNLTAHREFALPSGRRCDILVKNKNARFVWVIEAKVEATTAAIIQLNEYFDECLMELGHSGLRIGYRTLLAQYFREDTLQLAERMGIQCLHAAPINSNKMSIIELAGHSHERSRFETAQTIAWKWAENISPPPFRKLEVVNG